MTQKFRIKLKAYDHRLLDQAAGEIVEAAKRTGARIAGPLPLPTKKEIYTVNRSSFIDKKSREQLELSTHKTPHRSSGADFQDNRCTQEIEFTSRSRCRNKIRESLLLQGKQACAAWPVVGQLAGIPCSAVTNL